MYSLRSSTRRDDRPAPSDSQYLTFRESLRVTRSTKAASQPSSTPQPSSTIDPISKERRTELLQTIRKKRSLPTPPSTPRVPATISDLPAEVKHLVASYLDTSDTQSLVQVNRQWRSVVEPFNWSRISVYSELHNTLYDRDPVESLECWKRLAATVTSRPDLAARVDSFHFMPEKGAEVPMMTVLRCLAPTLQGMVYECECLDDCAHTSCQNFRVGSMMLDAVRLLPKLVRLYCRIDGDEWHRQLCRILRSTPSLELLSVFIGDDCPVPSRSDLEYADPVLPRLKELSIDAEDSIHFAATLLKGSPGVRQLDLISDRDNDGEEVEREQSMSDLQTILEHKGLTRLDLGVLSSPPLLQAMRTEKKDVCLENIRVLCICAPVCDTIRPMPKLEALCIVVHDHITTHYFAQSPTADNTGLLAPWVIRLLETQTSLTRLVISCGSVYASWSEERNGTKGLHFRVYAKNQHMFYHVRARVEDVLPGLLTAQGKLPLKRNADYPLYAQGKDFDHSGMAADGWLDFTSYLGKAVPKKMLGDLALDAGHERLWTQGQRGLSLSDQAWQKLKDWRIDAMAKENAEAFT